MTRCFSRLLTLGVAGLVVAGAHAQITNGLDPQAQSLETLRTGFLHPPVQARLRCYWWWLNGNTDKVTITRDLEEMKVKGFGGAILIDANGADQVGNRPVPTGPTFASPAWVELFTHALREADRLGLEITLNITSGWNLGGPSVTPEQASKLLTWSRIQVVGGQRSTVHLPQPEQRNGLYRQIAVLAYPLKHGVPLAVQLDDRQGDRHTAEQETQPAKTGEGDARAIANLRFRSAAAETGFSMPDASSMLNDGLSGANPRFSADASYSDAAPVQVRDLSSLVAPDGTLSWDAPAGQWELLRIGYTDSGAKVSTASGAWQGSAIDYLSRDAFEAYWQQVVEPLLTAARPYRSLKYLATDSWELGGTNWTDHFREQFIQRRGYDPVPWLPVVAGRILGDRSQSTRFLTDLRRTVADLVVSEHYDVFAAKARAHGMGMQSESGGPHGAPIDALETFRHAAAPQTEFWSVNAHRNTDVERFFTKEAASAANIYGKRLVAQEGETSIGPQWSESLATDLKPSFDMAITEGMNRLIWHEFTSSPTSTGLPGQEYFAGTHLNPKVTWWHAGKDFFAYLNRAQFLMQQGIAVNDVLYFSGDNVPNFVRLKSDDPAKVLPGFDYDVTNEDALLHTIRIQGSELVGPSGVRWRLLALPRTRRVSMAVLDLVARFLDSGGAVVGLAPLSPTGMTSSLIQTRFAEKVRAIWGSCAPGTMRPVGKGRVFCTDGAHHALAEMHIPEDFAALNAAGEADTSRPYAASNSQLDYAHRKVGESDLYFLRNGSAQVVTRTLAFRVQGKTAEVWDPVSGIMTPVAVKQLADRTTLFLKLAPYGSAFVVFDHNAGNPEPKIAEQRVEPLQFKGPWSVRFETDRGAPHGVIPMSELRSWTDSSVPGIRFFSGSATYSARVEAPAVVSDRHVLLHFADVREIAQVRINGKKAGSIWAMPYALDVTKLLHPGTNEVEVEVTNLWANRVIGDAQLGTTEKFTQTNITKYTADSPLLPSGLIGPVDWWIQ